MELYARLVANDSHGQPIIAGTVKLRPNPDHRVTELLGSLL